MTLTIVSGAVPGVEQGAIEAAVNLALRWQGWASREHLAALPAIYRTGLQPTSATDPGMVRRLNVQEADGALVFSTSMVLVGVPAFVDRVTEQMGRAFLHVTLNPAALQAPLPAEVVERVRAWLRDLPGRVYVTGPSADDVPGIQGAVRDALIAILEPFAVDEVRQTTRVLGLIEQAAGEPIEPGATLLRAPMVPASDPRYSRQHSDAEALAWPDVIDANMAEIDKHQLHGAQVPDGLEDLARRAQAAGGQPTHIAINPANADAAIAAGLDVQFVPPDLFAAPARGAGSFKFSHPGPPQGPDDARCGHWLPDGSTCGKAGTMDGRIGWRCPDHHRGPPEGLDEVQRAQLDASIREAERDIRDPVEDRARAYHELAATAPGPIGVAEHEDDEPPTPGD